MKERQRWQSEEDALLRAYVKQYGPRDWSLVSERTGKALDRDAKSCVERWKNYLKPGIKKGPLSDEEQNLVIRLQEKYGNKWKKIAAEVPGRTAKRLGKWWEVFKEKEKKEKDKERGVRFGSELETCTNYSEMLASFAEKFEQRHAGSSSSALLPAPPFLAHPPVPVKLVVPIAMSGCLSPNVNSATGDTCSKPGALTPWLPSTLATTSLVPNLETGEASRLSQARDSGNSSPDCKVVPRVLPCNPQIVSKSSSAGSTLPPWMSVLPSSTPTPGLVHPSPRSVVNTEVGRSHSPSVSSFHASSPSFVAASTTGGMLSFSSMPDNACVQGEVQRSEAVAHVGNQIYASPMQRAWCYTNPQSSRASLAPDLVTSRPLRDILCPKSLLSLVEFCKDLEDGRQSWVSQRKEAGWRVTRLEQKLEAEKSAIIKQKVDEVEARIRALREEERKFVETLDAEYREKISSLHREVEAKETKLMELWMEKHVQLSKCLEELTRSSSETRQGPPPTTH